VVVAVEGSSSKVVMKFGRELADHLAGK